VATVVTAVALYKVHDVSHVSQHKAVGLTADSDLYRQQSVCMYVDALLEILICQYPHCLHS